MPTKPATKFQWLADGWGVVGTAWGKSAKSVATYLRRIRDKVKVGELEDTPHLTEGPPHVRFASSVIRDLVAIGWEIKVQSGGQICIRPPRTTDLSSDAVRTVQLRSRNDQLSQPAVKKFIRELERRRPSASGWYSIFSLMRSGEELAEALTRASDSEDLKDVIDPYIQVADSDKCCEFTGLNLYDIWRYFRHTWVNPYQSVPGRSLNLLVRDAAAPNHPVIGIASLGSAVVHQTARDNLIGWQGDDVIKAFEENPSRPRANWLIESLDRLFGSIYTLDLIADGLIRKLDLRKPDDESIARLEREALAAKERHRSNPNPARISSQQVYEPGFDWEKVAEIDLYRSKRCAVLATLLGIRKAFVDAGFTSATPKSLRSALQKSAFRDAVRSLVARIKAERVGIDMMDITVCGAIPPYTHLLGGKLVCLLLTSPEVQRIYEKRYGNIPSIIASGLKGERVVRSPALVCLSTTSLYGRNSSQYNRVRLPAEAIGGRNGLEVRYARGGNGEEDSHRSQGFGTFHFRETTLRALDEWIKELVREAKDASAKRVNYIFGEGTSPKLRKLRDCISEVGLPGDEALKHERSRIVYFIALATNVGDYLLGLDKAPKWILPQKDPSAITVSIAEFWRKRWLSMRIKSPEVLEAVRQHSLAYPVTHGARVVIPDANSTESNDQEEFAL